MPDINEENRRRTDGVSDDRRTATTQFGFRRVIESEKDSLVRQVFGSVSNRYDLMNDLMSFGVHRMWKRLAVPYGGIRPNSSVLDVAGGTGDISLAVAKKLGSKDLTLSLIHISEPTRPY